MSGGGGGKPYATDGNDFVAMFNKVVNHKPDNTGLTKREYFAALALQGMLGGRMDPLGPDRFGAMVHSAVSLADILIKQLNEGGKS